MFQLDHRDVEHFVARIDDGLELRLFPRDFARRKFALEEFSAGKFLVGVDVIQRNFEPLAELTLLGAVARLQVKQQDAHVFVVEHDTEMRRVDEQGVEFGVWNANLRDGVRILEFDEQDFRNAGAAIFEVVRDAAVIPERAARSAFPRFAVAAFGNAAQKFAFEAEEKAFIGEFWKIDAFVGGNFEAKNADVAIIRIGRGRVGNRFLRRCENRNRRAGQRAGRLLREKKKGRRENKIYKRKKRSDSQ